MLPSTAQMKHGEREGEGERAVGAAYVCTAWLQLLATRVYLHPVPGFRLQPLMTLLTSFGFRTYQVSGVACSR